MESSDTYATKPHLSLQAVTIEVKDDGMLDKYESVDSKTRKNALSMYNSELLCETYSELIGRLSYQL